MFSEQYPGVPVVWFDAGGFAGDTSPAGRYQTETLLAGMRRLGYEAVNVTLRELQIGVPEFRRMAEEIHAEYPLVSASIVYQDDRSPVFEPFRVRRFQAGEWRGSRPLQIGIVGVARENPAFLGRSADGRRIIAISPAEAAARWVPEAARGSDLVVLLTDLDVDDVERILARVPGIAMVLAGHDGRVSDNFATPPAPSVVYAGDQGKRIGEVRVFLNSSGVASLTKTHLFLDMRYPYDPTMKRFEDDANMKINDFYRAAAYKAPAVRRDVPLAARFAGSSACADCHAEAAAVWEESGHAHAMQTLVDSGQEFNPLCTSCHSTGAHQAAGFQNVKATPELADVHCEECHGPGTAHLENFRTAYGKTDSARCLKCHTAENSPSFDFVGYWEKIKH